MVTAGDSPVETLADDVLGRRALARTVADEIRALDASRGFVVALTGPWGSGKTSLLNLVKLALADEPAYRTVDFNPWMFSGADQLVDAFLRELAAQLRTVDRLRELAEDVERYADYLAPLSWVPGLGQAVGAAKGAAKALQRRGSAVQQRDVLTRRLRELDKPLVVVVDDIDRLERNDIRDVFKLVRLTASFPNVVYVLAFDRQRVEQALNDQGVEGRAYLEKIVQLVIDVPALPVDQLRRQVEAALVAALTGIDVVRVDPGRWSAVLDNIVVPLLATMRDVSRYAASARPTVRAIGGDVNVTDVLALEAVRLFLPDTFRLLPKAQEALTSLDPERRTARARELVRTVAGEGDDHPARTVVRALFPAAGWCLSEHATTPGADDERAWRRERRVAHRDVLRRYLEHTMTASFATYVDAERACRHLGDSAALRAFLLEIEPARRQHVVGALELVVDRVPENVVKPAATTILDALPDMPIPDESWFIDPALDVRDAVRWLLGSLSPDVLDETVVDIAVGVRSLSGRLVLAEIVGDPKSSLRVTAGIKGTLRDALANDVTAARADDLAREHRPFRLVTTVRSWLPFSPPTIPDGHADLNRVVLLDAARISAGTRERSLPWDDLVAAYGSVDAVERAVDTLRADADFDPALARVVQTADRYLDGWRPEED